MLYNCDICEKPLAGRWTDLHGEMTCSTCGTPYQVLHYDKNNNPVDKPPRINIKEYYIPYLKEYWNETKKNMGLGVFISGNPNGEGYIDFMEWLNENVAPPIEQFLKDYSK